MRLVLTATIGNLSSLTSKHRWGRKFALVFAAVVIFAAAWQLALDRIGKSNTSIPTLTDSAPSNHVTQFESLAEAVTAARYLAEQTGGVASATNFQNQIRATFTPTGWQLESAGSKGIWKSKWRLQGLGNRNDVPSVDVGEVQASGNRVTISHRMAQYALNPTIVEEWFVNTPAGLEHGFTLSDRPLGEFGSLCLTVAVSGDLTPLADPDGKTLRLVNQRGEPILDYEKLRAWDANGADVPVRITAENARVIFEIDDAAARYPITIDPTFSASSKLVASDGDDFDHFGASVAIAGDTVIVGAKTDTIGGNAGQGSAYIFVRGSNGLWAFQQKLTAADGAANDEFGTSVGIAGDTVVVGAPFDAIGANDNQGSVYVYTRTGTTWTVQDKLLAQDVAGNDFFGFSVAIAADTVVIGALNDTVGGNLTQGSAYVFVRNGGIWTQQQKLTASDGLEGDQFGFSVATGGGTAVIGANTDDVGGDSARGSAYVFVRSGSTWTEQQRLIAGDGAPDDHFGGSVDLAINVESVIVGAMDDDVGGQEDRGSAYVFTRVGTVWTSQQKLTALVAEEDDRFGASVGIFGNTAIVGSDDISGAAANGQAHFFTRSGTVWSQRQVLRAFDGASGDLFGCSVALNGTTAIVGAEGDNFSSPIDQGSAHIFRLGSKQFDFDDDGRADISVFRPSNGAWYRLDSSTGQFAAVTFGQNGDIPAAGDFDGDGRTDIVVFRPSTGTWYLLNSTTGFAAVQFGQSGDIPVPGDADGDGKADVRVFRPSNGAWYLLNSSNGQFVATQFGTNGDLPIGGNYDGDSYADLAVYRPSTGSWYLLKTTGGFTGVQFGALGDRPVAADFDGDGTSDIAVFRPSNGIWYYLRSSNNSTGGFDFGQNGDIPVGGDFDGDGKTDFAVFRPSNGAWYLVNSA